MIDDHFREHPDPIVRMNDCEICGAAVRRALNHAMPELELGPKDARTLVSRLRRIAVGLE